MNNDKFFNDRLHCVAPFSSLVLLLSDEVQPCCNWIADSNFPIDSKILPTESINDLFEKTNRKTRKLFLKQEQTKYKICNKCFEADQSQYVMHNMLAKENDNHDYIANPLLTNLHIQPSNFCNLACRMCSPWNSNLLARERKTDKTNDYRFNSEKKYEIKNLSEGTRLFDSILQQLQYVNNLWFSGGEPLINKEVWLILKHAVDNDYAKNISLKFNTNGTYNFTPEKYAMIQSFKKLEIDVSMDGVGPVAEYIRTNVKFDEWLENFKIYRNLFKDKLSLVCTMSVFNIHLYEEFIECFNDDQPISINFCYWPEPLAVSNLNVKCKKFLIEKYSKSRYKNDKNIERIIEFLQIHMNSSNLSPKEIATFIENQDNNAIEQNLYKKYLPYRKIQPEWFDFITSD